MRLVVAFPPGGAADLLARLISQSLSETLGQPLIIENKGGSNGNIGGEAVARGRSRAPAHRGPLLVAM